MGKEKGMGTYETELLEEIVEEVISQSVCLICGMYQWNHKHWCPMQRAYELLGLTSEKQDYRL